MAFWDRFFGSAGSQAAGIAIGATAIPALRPAVQYLENDAWAQFPTRPPDAVLLSLGVAQGQVAPGSAKTWARQQGFDDPQWNAMVDTANVGPALGEAYRAWRRGALSDDQFQTAIKRQGIEDQWVAALVALKQNPLEPAEIAKAVHRGIMQGDGLLIAEPPTAPGKVPAVPPSSIDPIDEAKWSGIEQERLRILIGNAGLPLGLHEMLSLLNRGLMDASDVQRGIAESNLRNEYQDVALALARRLLTPHDYAEAELRGVMDHGPAQAGAALSGLEPEDYATLFAILGRPLSVKQITTGLARGGTYGGTYDDVPEPYRDAIRRSNVRPEYAVLDHANRYTIPSYFVLRAIQQAGGFAPGDLEKWFLQLGWPPELATKAAGAFAGGTATAADTHVSKAQTQLWTTAHRSYVAEESDDAAATTALTHAGVTAASIPGVLALWNQERELIRKQLTPAQIKKAWAGGVENPATGGAWTQDEAIAALISRGYSPNDAATFLAL